MMNANTTAAIAAIQEILATVTTTATTAITAINEILATVTTTETATTETTTEAATTETATTPEEKAIVVLDDDDNVIAVGATVGTETTATEATTTGDLPCPTAETAEAAATDATPAETATTTATETTTTETTTATTETTEVVETTIDGVTTARKVVAATEDDLINVYDLIKYVLRHEGVNCSVDKSVYAPSKNIHVSFNNERYKMYLSLHDNELVVMLMKNDNKEETVIMKMKATLSSVEVVTVDDEIETLASNARITAVINMMSSAIDLIK